MSPSVELSLHHPDDRDPPVDPWRASFERGSGHPVPNPVDDHRRFFDGHMLTETRLHPALQDGALVGFGAFTPASAVQLHVHVDHLRRGIGTRLLELAKANSHGRLWLHTVVTSRNAQRFHEPPGFQIIECGFEPAMQLGDLRYERRRAGR